MKKTKPVYSKVPQFQEDTQGALDEANDPSPDESDDNHDGRPLLS
jgi:hypothetical protein